MKFGRLRDGLDQMRERAEVAPEDVLDLFYDLCEDVREETGRSVDQLGMRDEEALVRRLPWTGNLFHKIYGVNRDRIQNPGRRRLLEGIEREAAAALMELEAAEEEQAGIRRAGEALEARRLQLAQARQEMERGREMMGRLQDKVDALEREIDPGLLGRARALQEKVEEKEREAEALRGQVSSQEEALAAAARETARLEKSRNQLRQQSEAIIRKNDGLRLQEREMEENLKNMDAMSQTLENRIAALQQNLDDRNYGNLRQLRLEKIEALEAQKQECAKLEADIAQTQAAAEKEEESFRRLMEDAEAARMELDKKLGDNEKKRQEQIQRRQQMQARIDGELAEIEAEAAAIDADRQAQEEGLRAREAAEEARRQEAAEELARREAAFREEVGQRQKAMEQEEADFLEGCRAQKEILDQQAARFEERCRAQEEILQKIREDHRKNAEQRRLDLIHMKEEIEREDGELHRQAQQMKAELEQLRNERLEARMEKARKDIAVMQGIRGALDENYAALLRACGRTPEEIPQTRLFDARLETVEKDLLACTALYRRLVRSLEGDKA